MIDTREQKVLELIDAPALFRLPAERGAYSASAAS
jgi:hypothetical protein